MYAGVPISAPVAVSVLDHEPSVLGVMVSSRPDTAVARGGPPSRTSSLVARARPKSVTTTRPSRPSSTLCGLKSRWTMPAAWAHARPSPASRNTARTSAAARGVRSQASSDSPSISSIAT